MYMKRRQFTEEFKLNVLNEVRSGKSIAEVTRLYQLNKNSVREWQQQAARTSDMVAISRGELVAMKTKLAEQSRKIGDLVLENEVLKKVTTIASRLNQRRDEQ